MNGHGHEGQRKKKVTQVSCIGRLCASKDSKYSITKESTVVSQNNMSCLSGPQQKRTNSSMHLLGDSERKRGKNGCSIF